MRLSSKHQKDSIWMKLMHRQTPGFYQMQRLSNNGTMLCHYAFSTSVLIALVVGASSCDKFCIPLILNASLTVHIV